MMYSVITLAFSHKSWKFYHMYISITKLEGNLEAIHVNKNLR